MPEYHRDVSADGLNALQAWVIACIFFVFGKLCFPLYIIIWKLPSLFAGALFEYSVILLQMKIKTIRQIRKCMNGNLAAYLSPLVGRNNYFPTFLQTIIIIWYDLGVFVTFYQIYMMFKELISSFRPTLWWADLQRRTEQEEVWNMSGNIFAEIMIWPRSHFSLFRSSGRQEGDPGGNIIPCVRPNLKRFTKKYWNLINFLFYKAFICWPVNI